MSTIAIHNLADRPKYEVVEALWPGRVVIAYEGALVFADYNNVEGGWELSQDPPSAEDEATLKRLIEERGGFDKTSVVVTPPTSG